MGSRPLSFNDIKSGFYLIRSYKKLRISSGFDYQALMHISASKHDQLKPYNIIF